MSSTNGRARQEVRIILDEGDSGRLVSACGKEGLRHGALDLPLDRRGGGVCEGPRDLSRNLRSQEHAFDLGGNTL